MDRQATEDRDLVEIACHVSLAMLLVAIAVWSGVVSAQPTEKDRRDLTVTEVEKTLYDSTVDPTAILGSEGTDVAYSPAGYRDPFVRPGSSDGDRPTIEGVAGTTVQELELNGILQDATGEYYALMVANDGKAYPVRTGDKVYDGRVQSVSRNKIVLEEHQFNIVTGDPEPPKRVTMRLHVEQK